jgi:Ca2+-binding RTX toxin-like protein
MAIATKPTTATVFGTVSSGDYLVGTAANDIITGGGVATIAYTATSTGFETMEGSAGDDSYIVDNINDIVTENPYQGVDTIYTTVSYTLPSEVENIQAVQPASSAGLVIVGNLKDNIIDAGSQNNVSDTIKGMEGSDTYIIDSNDKVLEGKIVTNTAATLSDYTDTGGIDTIISPSTIDLSPLITAPTQQSNTSAGVTQDRILGAAYIENVLLTGTTAANIIGNIKDNILTGNDAVNSIVGGNGNDTIDGGIEATADTDTLVGGAGNDVYIIRNSSDIINETIAGSSGTDVVKATASYVLPLGIENLSLLGTAAINGEGNITNNLLTGNDAANILYGDDNADSLHGGADSINGFGGNDTIDAGFSNDTIIGGAGKDTVMTGLGFDIIKFAAATADTVAATGSISGVDWYKDLTLNGTNGDKIDLTVAVAKVGLAVNGAVSEASFVSTMNSLLGASGKGFAQTVGGIDAAIVTAAFTPVTGSAANKSFLAVDLNANDGFDTGDFVIDITGSTITSLLPTSFVTAPLYLTGTTGNDILDGRAGNDIISGGLGRDVITTGGGNDIVRFGSGVTDTYALNSSVVNVDWYKDLTLNANLADKIDLTVIVAHVGLAVTGSLNQRSFINDMNTLVTTSGKGFAQYGGGIDAAVVTANAGTLSGKSYIAVDLDSTGSFTATDFVIEITGSTVTALTTASFA